VRQRGDVHGIDHWVPPRYLQGRGYALSSDRRPVRYLRELHRHFAGLSR
jgi:hypothetical protein